MYDVACTARQLSASKGQPCKRTSKIENQTSKISCDKVRFRGATKLGLRIIVCVKTKPDGYAPNPSEGGELAIHCCTRVTAQGRAIPKVSPVIRNAARPTKKY